MTGRSGATAAGAWELVVVGGPLAGRRFPLPAGELTLGRGSGCDIRLEDPAVSRAQLRLRVEADAVRLLPSGASAATYLDGRPVAEGHPAGREDVLEIGHSLLAIRRAAAGVRTAGAAGARVPFNRPPAGVPAPADLQLRLPQPPAEPPRLRVPVAAVLAPLVVGLAVWIAARSVLGLLLALGTPLMAVAPALEDRVTGRWQRGRQRRRFREQLAAAARTLAVLRAREARACRRLAPDPVELEARAARVLPSLWERRPDRPGFLHLRTGWSDLPSAVRIDVPEGGAPDLRAELTAAAGAGAVLRAVPLSLHLAACGPVGLAGPRPAAGGLARWLLAQAAVLHSPRELALAAFLPEAAPDREWLHRLPHTRGGHLGLGTSLLPESPAEQRRLALALAELAKPGGTRAPAGGPALLVLVHEDAPVERGLLSRLLRELPAARQAVLWLGSMPELLPDGCRAVIELEPSGLAMRVRDLAAGTEVAGIPDLVDVAYAGRVARALAVIEEVGVPAAEDALPAAAGLIECLHGSEGSEGSERRSSLADADLRAAVRRRWAAPPGDLAAPVGVGAGGVVTLDLREDGPHALVGGTSGSGKSEFLRTWVTALAATHSPRRLSFLLVDFKGGTAFRDCARLPHVAGLVTDLDEHLLGRVRDSLLAELKRREAEMARVGHKEFTDFERRHPQEAFPVLVVVFDEFEQLLAEHPDFVREVIVPAARLGRGLGVHLVLGTQRPQGAVPEAIRSNTGIRVALRMLSEEQSRDVIDAPDAARIAPSARGRAHLRLSYQSLVPLQVAYAGTASGSGPTDFERLAAAMTAVAPELGQVEPCRPWLPPLPPVVRLADLLERRSSSATDLRRPGTPSPHPAKSAPHHPTPRNPHPATPPHEIRTPPPRFRGDPGTAISGGPRDRDFAGTPGPALASAVLAHPPRVGSHGSAPPPDLRHLDDESLAGYSIDAPGRRQAGPPSIGLADEPRRQAQWPLTHDPVRDGHLLVHGPAGSGKSTLLRTLACALAQVHRPSTLWIYAVDVSSGVLRSLEALPHVGAVAGADEPERVVQVLRRLGAEVAARRRLLRERAPSSWRDAGMPTVLLLLDELSTFRALFERVDGGRYVDLLDGLVRDGRAVGVHCAIATGQRRDLTGPLAAAISRRLLLCPDRQDREALGLPAGARLGPAPSPGRALVDGRLEAQVAVLADGTEAGEAAAVAVLAARLRAAGGTPAAPRVPVLPEELEHGRLPEPAGPLRPVLGLGGDAVAPVEVDLLVDGHLVVCGPRASGRTTALAALVTSECRAATGARMVLLSGRRHSELAGAAGWTRMALGPERCRELAAALVQELAMEEDVRPVLVVVDDAELLAEGACDGALRDLARLGRDVPLRMAVAVEARALRRYSEWLSEVRESRHAVLLHPDVSTDGELFGVGPLPRPLRPYPPGRGFLVRAGHAVSVQVAR